MAKTLEEHAVAIQAAIYAAAADGFELDNRQSDPVHMDLNKVVDGKFHDEYVQIFAPHSFEH